MNNYNISSVLEQLCPLSLAKFEFNGLLIGVQEKKEVKRLAFTLGFSKKSIQQAISKRIDMLVVHNAPEGLSNTKDKYYKDIKEMLYRSSLPVYRMHLPLDFVKDGIIDQLCKLMHFDGKPAKLTYEKYSIVGGVYTVKENIVLEDVVKRVRLLNPNTIRVTEARKRRVENIAIASGDGCKPEFLLQMKPDIFICGLLNQESIRIANDLDITLIEATSYATENEPLKRFVELKKNFFKNVEVSFIDVKNNVIAV